MNWQEKREWFLYGMRGGPYVISLDGDEKDGGLPYSAWLLGHHLVDRFRTLEEAKAACEKEAVFVQYPHKRGAGAE